MLLLSSLYLFPFPLSKRELCHRQSGAAHTQMGKHRQLPTTILWQLWSAWLSPSGGSGLVFFSATKLLPSRQVGDFYCISYLTYDGQCAEKIQEEGSRHMDDAQGLILLGELKKKQQQKILMV